MSHVCGRVREAVIGAPALWTLVEADFYFEGSVQIFKLYLERSRGCKIWAMCKFSSHRIDHHLIAERLGHILPHTHRISRLGIISRTDSLVPILAAFRDVSVPALQGLEIELGDIYNCPLELFSSGPPPALTFLKMAGFTPQFPLPRWMASLTHLEFRRSDDVLDPDGRSAFVELITQCPALSHLYIDTSCCSRRDMNRIPSPSLKSLHVVIEDFADTPALTGMVGLFDTPALTELTIAGAHGDQICHLFDETHLRHSSFPALTSLSFVNDGSCKCEMDADLFPAPIPSQPLRLFPALSSLTLINQCFTSDIVGQILGPALQPWPLLDITLCPKEYTVEDVYSALQGAIHSKRQHEEAIPKFCFSPVLFQKSYWDENGVGVEVFDPAEVLAAFR
ncbi:hypothetical protein FB451DRAFT_1236449 [Mycena latifolia]|nr:hypothetical protein FB451DRAFT_1236449 [Mycena latifolia]